MKKYGLYDRYLRTYEKVQLVKTPFIRTLSSSLNNFKAKTLLKLIELDKKIQSISFLSSFLKTEKEESKRQQGFDYFGNQQEILDKLNKKESLEKTSHIAEVEKKWDERINGITESLKEELSWNKLNLSPAELKAREAATEKLVKSIRNDPFLASHGLRKANSDD